MRLVALAVLLLAVLLAGCATPPKDKDEDPLFGLCPQWAQGPGSTGVGVDLTGDGSVSEELGPADARYLDRPLDLFRVHIDSLSLNGTLELRAKAADGSSLILRDYRRGDTQMVPVATLDPTAVDQEFDIFLSPVLDDGPAAPQPATLDWTLDGSDASVQYTVTYHYKVCGL